MFRGLNLEKEKVMHSLTMWNDLIYAEKDLPELLQDVEGWNSLYIDYHEPFVERLWRDHDGCRIFLHELYACRARDALYHPHPWPSIMRVHEGMYEMGIGYGAGEIAPPVVSKLLLREGSVYEMTQRDGWHYVAPLVNTMTVMVTGKPWDRPAPKSDHPLRPLTDGQKRSMLRFFRSVYS